MGRNLINICGSIESHQVICVFIVLASKVLRVLKIKIMVLWNVMLCGYEIGSSVFKQHGASFFRVEDNFCSGDVGRKFFQTVYMTLPNYMAPY